MQKFLFNDFSMLVDICLSATSIAELSTYKYSLLLTTPYILFTYGWYKTYSRKNCFEVNDNEC